MGRYDTKTKSELFYTKLYEFGDRIRRSTDFGCLYHRIRKLSFHKTLNIYKTELEEIQILDVCITEFENCPFIKH